MNTINVISPCKDDDGKWVYDDARFGLTGEPLVDGTDRLIDLVVAHNHIPNAERGFALIFSGAPFSGQPVPA
jgi:hypothetical protein